MIDHPPFRTSLFEFFRGVHERTGFRKVNCGLFTVLLGALLWPLTFLVAELLTKLSQVTDRVSIH